MLPNNWNIMEKNLSINSQKLENDSEATCVKEIVIKLPISERPKSSSKSGLPCGWKRATFILKEEHLDKLKACAYWERVTLKELIDEMIAIYLDTKKINKIPKREHGGGIYNRRIRTNLNPTVL